MLIVYPTDNWDSFTSLADAETNIANNIPSASRVGWDALTVDADKEIYLRQATTIIRGKITLPSTLEDDLKLATAYQANYSVGIDQTRDNGNGNLKIKNIVGVTEKEWFSPRDSNNDLIDIVDSLLKDYIKASEGSFSFDRA